MRLRECRDADFYDCVNGAPRGGVYRTDDGHVVLPRYERLHQLAAALNLPVGELLVRSGWAGAD